jgi:hypothetical protein
MRHNHRAQTDFTVVADLNRFGIFVLQVNVFADEHTVSDLDPAPSM